MKNSINWFEIPVTNFERAKSFYSDVLKVEISEMPHPEFKYGMLPFDSESEGIGGAIVQGEWFEPSQKGSLVYLNGGNDLNEPLSRIEAAGGKVVMPKTDIGPNGFIAIFLDTEGNRVAFHSFN